MKITIIGNSVALRVRPNLKIPNNKNYTSFLNDSELAVENKAIGALTVLDIMPIIDGFVNSFPSCYILNLGVVDACSREVPLWFYRIATSRKSTKTSQFFHFFYRNILSKVRPLLVWVRFKKPWVSKKIFRKQYSLIVKTLLKETNAFVICLGINLANDRVEKLLPGSRERQTKYNEIIEEIAKHNKQIFINTEDLDSETYYPDGVHYNIAGHELIAERILTEINRRENL